MNLIHKETLKKLGLFSLEKGGLRGHLMTFFQQPKGRCRGGEGIHGDRRRNRHKLLQRKFHLDIGKKYFTTRTHSWATHLSREVGPDDLQRPLATSTFLLFCGNLTLEAVESPLLEILKTQLVRAPDHLIQGLFFNRKLDEVVSRGLFQGRLFYNFYPTGN